MIRSAFCLVFLLGAATAAPISLTFGEEGEVDLGTMWAGEFRQVLVSLDNPATEDIHIEHIATTCGCMVPHTDIEVIPAFSSVDFWVQFHAPEASGESVSRILFSTEPGSNVQWEIAFVSHVRRAFDLLPREVNFGHIRADNPTEECSDVRIVNHLGTPLPVTSISATPSCFVPGSNSVVIPPQSSVDVPITFHPPQSVVTCSGSLSVQVSHEFHREARSHLIAQMVGHVGVRPSRVWFGTVSLDTPHRYEVIVYRDEDPDAFEVFEATTDMRGIAVEVAPDRPGAYAIVVTIDPQRTTQTVINSEITVSTNDTLQRELRIPILGVIRRN